MKVGILTLHYTNNYGAVLQCLALQRTLELLGHDASVLDMRALATPPHQAFWQGWGLRRGSVVRNFAYRWITLRHRKRAAAKFERFRSTHLRQSELCADSAALEDQVRRLDALVVGSDQVWNVRWFHPVYFLGFRWKSALRRVAYAACAGHVTLPTANTHSGEIARGLSSFHSISVRDHATARFVEDAVGVAPSIVADPTLLADLTDVQLGVKARNGRYALCYLLHPENRALAEKIVQLVREKWRLPVVCIVCTAHEVMYARGADTYVSRADPGEWLQLMANATFVCTDSFHGVMFSVRNAVPFAACVADRRLGGRITDAAERYGFENALIESSGKLTTPRGMESACDFAAVHREALAHAARSREWLATALSDAEQGRNDRIEPA